MLKPRRQGIVVSASRGFPRALARKPAAEGELSDHQERPAKSIAGRLSEAQEARDQYTREQEEEQMRQQVQQSLE